MIIVMNETDAEMENALKQAKAKKKKRKKCLSELSHKTSHSQIWKVVVARKKKENRETQMYQQN